MCARGVRPATQTQSELGCSVADVNAALLTERRTTMRAVFSSLLIVLITGVPLICRAQQDTPHKVSGGCPASPTNQIEWGHPLGGDSLTCTGKFAGTTSTIQYFISN